MNRVDDNGKIFTDHVRKTRVEVRIFALHADMHGYVHMVADRRVRDMLNDASEQFIAVTDVSMKVQGTLEWLESDFIALNKNHIISVIPLDEDKVRRQQAEEYYRP